MNDQPPLTPREQEVWDLRQHNLSLRTIALTLNLSISTIRSTLERIERKLGKDAA